MQKFCIKCGNQINNEAVFCDKCGARVNNNTSATTENVTQPSPITPEPRENYVSAKSASQSISDDSWEEEVGGLRAKANSEPEKKPVPIKRIIIAIFSIAILGTGGTAAYLMLSDSGKDGALKDASSIITSESDKDSSVIEEDTSGIKEDSGDSSSEQIINGKWEIRDVGDPEDMLETVTVNVNGFNRQKFKTNINATYKTLNDYFEEMYGGDNSVDVAVLNNENIYTRMSDGKDYSGIKGDYKIAITDKESKETVAGASLSEMSAVFDGACGITFEMTSDGNVSAVQTELYDRISRFISDETAEYLVYGKGNSIPEIDSGTGSMKYNTVIAAQNLKVDAYRDVVKNTDGTYKVSVGITYTPTDSEDDLKLYYDLSEASVYDNAATTIDQMIPGTQKVDYKKSHEFMDDAMKSLSTKNKEFIDTKLELMEVVEMKNGDAIKNEYKFNVALGISGIKYSDAPSVSCELSAQRNISDNTVTDYHLLITGDTTSNDVTEAVINIVSESELMFPQIKDCLKAEDIAKKLASSNEYQTNVNINVFDEETVATLKINKGETITFTIEYSKLTEEDIPSDIPDNSSENVTGPVDDDIPSDESNDSEIKATTTTVPKEETPKEVQSTSTSKKE